MWVCNTHMKEALSLLETPHISKAPYQIKCSLCDNRAFAKVFYAHQSYQFTKNQYKYSLSRAARKKLG